MTDSDSTSTFGLRPQRARPAGTPLAGRSLGIIGGCSPAAAAHLHGLVVRLAQLHFGAQADADFPEIIVLSRPLSGMNAAGFSESSAPQIRDELRAAQRRLLSLGAQVILPACNSVSALISGAGVISLTEVAAQAAKTRGARRVGVLSSSRSRAEGLHRQALEARGIEAVEVKDAEQRTLDALISAVMGGGHGRQEHLALASLSAGLQDRGVDAVIIGCTELSIIPLDGPFPCIEAAACAALDALLRLSEAEPAPASTQESTSTKEFL